MKKSKKYVIERSNLSSENSKYLALVIIDEFTEYDPIFQTWKGIPSFGYYIKGKTINLLETGKEDIYKAVNCYTKEKAYKLFFDTFFERWQ